MHIPDGYLGPYTYVAFWIIMIPIWYHAGKKLSAELKSRTVPAMVLEHALGFSILEALITALIFAYIQRTDTTVLYGEKSELQKNKIKKAISACGETNG